MTQADSSYERDATRDGARAQGGNGSVFRAVPGLARIGAVAWLRTAEWSISTSWRASTAVLRAAAAGESPGAILDQATGEVRTALRRLLGLGDEGRNGRAPPGESASEDASADADEETSEHVLRERGADLLRRSAEVGLDEDPHPAYAHILGELAPDEARILRLLTLEGPQPALDVRSGGPLTRSRPVATGVNMVAAESGCRRPDRVRAYLNNLNRLGLVWFANEPIGDQRHYQVLEAQPEVGEALEEAGRGGRTIRRSIELTPLGRDFCDTCLPLDTAEMEALPGRGPNGD
jgi:hypothetical protein